MAYFQLNIFNIEIRVLAKRQDRSLVKSRVENHNLLFTNMSLLITTSNVAHMLIENEPANNYFIKYKAKIFWRQSPPVTSKKYRLLSFFVVKYFFSTYVCTTSQHFQISFSWFVEKKKTV